MFCVGSYQAVTVEAESSCQTQPVRPTQSDERAAQGSNHYIPVLYIGGVL